MMIIGMIGVCIGVLLTLVAVIGLFRFPDTYTRIKSLALLGFPAAILIHASSSLLLPSSQGSSRGWITAFLFFVTGPVLNHAIMLAAHRTRVKRNYELDELGEAAAGCSPEQDADDRSLP